MDQIPPQTDPVPAIVTLVPHDPSWERWVRRRLGPRLLPWSRVPRYRRVVPAAEAVPIALPSPRRRSVFAPAKAAQIVH